MLLLFTVLNHSFMFGPYKFSSVCSFFRPLSKVSFFKISQNLIKVRNKYKLKDSVFFWVKTSNLVKKIVFFWFFVQFFVQFFLDISCKLTFFWNFLLNNFFLGVHYNSFLVLFVNHALCYMMVVFIVSVKIYCHSLLVIYPLLPLFCM